MARAGTLPHPWSEQYQNHPSADRNNRRCDSVVRASAQSPVVDAVLNRIEPEVAPLGVFIPPEEQKTLVAISLDEAAEIFKYGDTENELQKKFCYFLKRNGFDVPTVVESRRRTTRDNPETDTAGTIGEQALSNVLEGYHAMEGEPPQKLRRVELARSVTTSSRCDVSVGVSNTCTSFNSRELVIGELKQRETYTVSQCVAQASLCLQTVLYFWRVPGGLNTDTAYGFAVCGPNCDEIDNDKYSIVLLKVTAPIQLGEPLLTQQHVLLAESLQDLTPMQVLFTFLRRGNRSLRREHSRITEEKRCPSRFLLPTSMWNVNGLHLPKNYRFVQGGTMAVVFKANASGIKELLEKSEFQLFVPFPTRLERMRNGIQRKKFPYYVKFQQGYADDFNKLLKKKDALSEELRITYPLPALSTSSSYCIIMRSRGDPVTARTFSSFDDLHRAFQLVWDTAKILCQTLPPCDTLPHNFVYDSSDGCLHLIDIDDGKKVGKEIKKRIVEKAENFTMATAYPNCLRWRPFDYALVQLAVSLLILSSGLTTTTTEEEQRLANVVSQLDVLDAIFQRIGNLVFHHLSDEVAAPIGSLEASMVEWFGDWR